MLQANSTQPSTKNAKHTTTLAARRTNGANPPVVAREYLESLGYKLREATLTNHEQGLQIHAVERIEDGSVTDFSFCADLQGTVGGRTAASGGIVRRANNSRGGKVILPVQP